MVAISLDNYGSCWEGLASRHCSVERVLIPMLKQLATIPGIFFSLKIN